MTPDQIALGFVQYVVFLLSTTCHEAAHAFAAQIGGDLTAAESGQVSLNPLPHIRREPFGMVVMPLLGWLSQSGLIGWASAPYDPLWAMRYPKRAAWMSLAGPAANFSLSLLAALAIRIGLMAGVFSYGDISPYHLVSAPQGSAAEGFAIVLSVMFSLNILLGIFNLLPFPPLDGFGVLGLFITPDWARKLQEWRVEYRSFTFLGLVLGWRLIDYVYGPVWNAALTLVLPK